MAAIDAEAHARAELTLVDHVRALGDRLVNATAAVERAMNRPPAQPFIFRPNASGKSGATGDLVLDLGGPQSGRFWEVLAVTVGGNRWASVVAGVGLIVVSSTPPANAAATPVQWVSDTFASLPIARTGYGRSITINPPERLFVVIATPTATTEYDAAATVQQYETGPRQQTVSS